MGNGWTPEKIDVQTWFVEPKPNSEILRHAEARKRALFRRRGIPILKPREEEVGTPTQSLRLIPFWRIRGFHECFYFRGNSYKITLPDDVIAVEIEGRVRDLVEEDDESQKKLASYTRRLLGIRGSSGKSIRIGEVTELAYMYKEGTLFVNADGKEDLEAEAFFEGSLPLRRVSEKQLQEDFRDVEIVKGSVSKEKLVQRLHSMIVKPPPAFTKILNNRFQVTELTEFLMPVYVFEYVWRGRPRQVKVHGYTGAIL